ncbi:MAG TPA: hypothetical protein VMF61_13350, partial [Candidatus Acidoferrales bacterium]|nr:hypothetical protein [Candidatus Acidoferrales bacterium]
GKYTIGAANQALLLGDDATAARLFAGALAANPGSADAQAGLGVIAYRRGDLQTARGDLARARALDERSGMVRALTALLGTAPDGRR